MADKTPREEFEEMFGEIIDEQWQWLKEFLGRNLPAGVVDYNEIVGFRVEGRIYHPTDVELIKRDATRVIDKAELLSLSLDREPNAFGYGIENVEILHEEG